MNFKYILKNNSIDKDSFDYIGDYLRSLGIKKVESFLDKPESEDYISPKKLKNMEEIVDRLHTLFLENKHFYLQPDADVDGYTSAAIFYRYFKDIYPNLRIDYEVHEGKEHGIILSKIPSWVDVVIIPDAGSNDFEQQEKLSDEGKEVFIIDHHEVDNLRDIPNVYITNNQLSPEYENKFLSGAGMVYKLIHLYSEKYGDGKSHENYIDLAAIGIISDMMDGRTLDNQFIIYNGLRNIKNPLIKALLAKQSYSVSNVEVPNKIDIAFYITPLINALIRVGGYDENMDFFEGMIDYNNTEVYTKIFRGTASRETFYEKLAREAYNTRTRQNKVKEKAMLFLDEEIQEKKLYENAILTVVVSKDDDVTLPKTLTGLVAMEFVKKYKKPTIVVRPKTVNGVKELWGSGRANPVDGFKSFRDELNNSGIVRYAQGHDSAFGLGVPEEKLKDLITYFNTNFGHIDFGSETIEVDYAFEHEPIDGRMLSQFAYNKDIYGNRIPEAKFAFRFLLNKNLIKVIGAKESTLKIDQDGMTFIKFNAKEEIDLLTDDSDDFFIDSLYEVTIIGRPQINEFNGVKNIQVIIDNFHAKKFDKKSLL